MKITSLLKGEPNNIRVNLHLLVDDFILSKEQNEAFSLFFSSFLSSLLLMIEDELIIPGSLVDYNIKT